MAPPSPNVTVNTISYPSIQVLGSMDNSYPGAMPKFPFNPAQYRTRHLSLARPNSNNPRRNRASQDFLRSNNAEFERSGNESDFIPLLASSGMLADNLQQQGLSKEEAKERMEGLSQLISRLEDTTSLLRDQLSSVKKTLKGGNSNSRVRILKPVLPWLFKYQIIIVAFLQLITLTLMTIYDTKLNGNKPMESVCKVFLVIFQLLNTVHVVLATYKLSKKIKNGGLGTVMAQTYMTTVLVFAGLYFTIYRFDHDSWEFETQDKINEGNAFVQYVRMLYLSVSSATLCGAANIQPKAWYVTIIVCCQNIMNFVYFASILAQTIGDFNAYTVSVRHRESIVSEVLHQSQRPNVVNQNTSYQRYGEIPD